MKVQNLVITYLDKARLMQVATCHKNRPWACTVYFAHDNLHNLYWLSHPDSHHSQHIAKNPYVAGAITVPLGGASLPGIQVFGTVRAVTDPAELENVFAAYAERYTAHAKLQDVISGRNPNHFYQLKPMVFVLFDETNFPNQPRQEWRLS